MGQTLSEPVVEKHSDEGQDDRVVFGISAMQGWRINMEDAHANILDLQPLEEGNEELKPADSDVRISYFGVYDGHGGDKVALYTGEHLHKIIAKQEAFKKKDFEQALKDGFLAIDRAILSDPKYEEEVSGCTSTVGIVTKDKIYVGNAGDSRTVLGIKGRAKPLSFDHKPQNEGEKARICAAGGFVDFGRVNGNLALSRAIGDFEFKKSADLPPEQQIVTVYPDVTVHEITEDDEFIVFACDGIWDCQSSQAVVEFVRRGIAAKQELKSICENMMDNCLASNSETGGVGCDNMTMTIVALLQGKTKDEWYKMVGDRVANGDGPCAPPEYGKSRFPAGPGRHHSFDDSADEYEMDMDQRTRMIGRGNAGRVILLGDGTEVNADHDDDVEMEDRGEAEELEDKDLAEQVQKGQADAKADTNGTEKDRGDREQTPGPNAPKETVSEPQVEEKEVKSPMSPTVPTKLDPASTQPPEMKVPIEGVDNKKAEEEKSASESSK
ncbi:Protein phosphatase 2C 2 [Elasticomyces elasticus]|nr:Protein phosphatase 2C 2 [Elasticomyces elasticus]KAK3653763.1 Protein phosphatase 2C 2 [Elasticomyces elasticus]KAK4924128.1 Protein phosphatase 2C 2 [Elasticomyces elasticus]KAK5758476.1 Protein phosphatase 2C 2 [Elasticomyces elasticus]